jgi:pimeloyl-ACP methyl ester carboxylesterase
MPARLRMTSSSAYLTDSLTLFWECYGLLIVRNSDIRTPMNKSLIKFGILAWGIWCLVLFPAGCSPKEAAVPEPPPLEVLQSRLVLETTQDEDAGVQISHGTYEVYENRDTQTGRKIHLKIVILHSSNSEPRPDPVFFLAGGPGQAAAEMWRGFRRSSYLEERDIVLVNQRGTGGDNLLAVKVGSENDLQGYLDPTFRVDTFRAALPGLEERFDLTQYSTPHAMDDLNEIRIALGYDQINLIGGSYGTRASLVYMRRYPESVRCAVLNDVAPIAFRNPLYHAFGAQYALDVVLDQCAADPECSRAFPDVRAELEAVLARLDRGSADTEVRRPGTQEDVPVRISRETFVETLRGMMYSTRRSRFVPLYIHQAFQGNFRPIAAEALNRNRGLTEGLALGMLQCVVCAEDIDRIDPAEIEKETGDTFFGDFRVRMQMAICEFWPRSKLPANYGDPVNVDVPVLLLSGTFDAVTPPRWGAEVASNLPNSLHVVAPGAHGVGGQCIREIIAAFLDTASVSQIDTACVEDMQLPPFSLK